MKGKVAKRDFYCFCGSETVEGGVWAGLGLSKLRWKEDRG